MKIPFEKYHGTGNDFILIDQREKKYLTRRNTATIRQMCSRHFGIGADGLMFLQNKKGYDFEMIYFNSDGNESSMCGNGGRCISHFAHQLGIFRKEAKFLAIDGDHEAKVLKKNWVELKMGDVSQVEKGRGFFVLDTGSPHYVKFVKDVAKIDVNKKGSAIRYNERFRKEGINVNFVEPNGKGIKIATYERGVENETLSCGTGITAAAISYALRQMKSHSNFSIPIEAKGGNLEVKFEIEKNTFKNIWLCGEATFVFKGVFEK